MPTQKVLPKHSLFTVCRQFPEEAKDASVSECTWTLSALEALRNALYKFKTYLLTIGSTTPRRQYNVSIVQKTWFTVVSGKHMTSIDLERSLKTIGNGRRSIDHVDRSVTIINNR